MREGAADQQTHTDVCVCALWATEVTAELPAERRRAQDEYAFSTLPAPPDDPSSTDFVSARETKLL